MNSLYYLVNKIFLLDHTGAKERIRARESSVDNMSDSELSSLFKESSSNDDLFTIGTTVDTGETYRP